MYRESPRLLDFLGSNIQVLLDLWTPVLIVQGTLDALCPLDLLDDVRKKMTAPSQLHVMYGGDHSLVVSKTKLKASGLSQHDADLKIREVVANFLADLQRAQHAR